ncbi:MAG: hypothetical protein U0235_02885 [Polyangiaceae bacterium]
MKTALAGSIVSFTVASAVVACAPDVPQPEPRATKTTTVAPPPASSAETSLGALPPPVVAVPDAGAPKADAAAPPKPNLPPANFACQDLTRCCAQVRNPIEKAGCLAIVSQGAGVCANALIAFQVAGGCGRKGSSLLDIFNSDGSLNASKDCTYLERACLQDPTQCDAAYRCNGVTAGGRSTNPGDACSTAVDPYCCRYPSDIACMQPTDPCASAVDPYCCRYPNDFDCGGSPDPCATAADRYCCEWPSAVGCSGSTSSDPCDYDPDPACCRDPNACAPPVDPCQIDPEGCYGY